APSGTPPPGAPHRAPANGVRSARTPGGRQSPPPPPRATPRRPWRRAAVRRVIAARAGGASSQSRSLVGRHRYADHVTLAVDGLDDLRRARVVAEDLPQAADAHVDAAIEGIGVAAAQQLRQLGTAQHAIAGREQYREQSVLGAAERDLPAGGLF